jgi:hypothetical protein
MTETEEQYVYVMSNISYPDDLLKIGWTREHPNIRANDLHTSGIPTPFNVEYVIITQEGSKLEKNIHEHLKTYRVNSNREFFKISKDELTQILIKDLTLELTPITEIIAPIDKKLRHGKWVNDIKLLYEKLEKETDVFFSKLRRKHTQLVVNENNNQKIVSLKTNKSSTDALDWVAFDDDTEEERIRKICYFINEDIIRYKKWVEELVNDYEKIKIRIGIVLLRQDNKLLKEMILETHRKLNNLKSEYIWKLDN